MILATFAGLLVREDIAATPIDWIARRVPPSGVEFDAPRGAALPRRLSSLIPAGRAWLDDEDRAALDKTIGDHAKGWTLQRMPSIDRNVLRIASFELMGRPDVPIAVVLDDQGTAALPGKHADRRRFRHPGA